MKRLLFFVLLILFISGQVFAADNQNLEDAQKKQTEVQEQIAKLTQQINEAQNKQKTLANQISYMNNQITRTALQINETETKIKQLGEDINTLTTKINRLEDSLSHLSEVLLNRIVVTYKTNTENSWLYLFNSGGLTDFFNRYKYLRTAQNHDKKLLMEMEGTKKNYGDQKNLLEIKKMEVEKLKRQLEPLLPLRS